MASPALRSSRPVGILLVMPYLVLLVCFGIIPIGVAIINSLEPTRRNPAGGLANYGDLFSDFRFLPALLNVGTFLAIYLPVMLVMVTISALLLDAYQSKWNTSLRLAFIVPGALSGAVAVLVWYFMLDPNLSPFGEALRAVGITSTSQIWQQGNLAWIFALMAFATGAGNWIVIQYGSLQSIPDELVEAARLDGCNLFQIAYRIKLPLIKKYLVYMSILCFTAAIQIFVEPQIVGSIYPGLADAWSLNQLSFDFAFENSNFASSAALSLVLFGICLLAALILIFRTDFFDSAREEA
ncbi:multiple sugar transport system permease protein [Microbacterium sp. SLBN-154]|uniref:carbohydrate ABC transporter permease n=1 Tax=Microbacterium sp. SLBN-154 TaxID=2768458 RepID=UPI001150CE15|nr:sugar ABC transporter permease [Microbacterium sp. SLBN-154]TQK17699.1 multiple sugar transport system permease protein [Microbacterium sp. SLBN-154]